MNYAQLKKLDDETLNNIKEGSGPVDECLCSLLAPDEQRKGFRESLKSIKKAFGAFRGAGGGNNKQKYVIGGPHENTVEIPLTFTKGGKGLYSTKETVKRTSPCGKCGCDDSNIVLKHSYANIRISTPDISSFCSCPSKCLPNADQLNNNIQVTIEQLAVKNERDIDSVESEFSFYDDESVGMSTITEVDDSLRSTSSVKSDQTLK